MLSQVLRSTDPLLSTGTREAPMSSPLFPPAARDSGALPDGVVGEPWLLRVSSRIARDPHDACPTATHLAVRPLLAAAATRPYPAVPVQDFGLGLLMRCLDFIEHHNRAPEDVFAELHRTAGTFGGRDPAAHPALLRWTTEAVTGFLAARTAQQARDRDAGLPPTRPEAGEWVVRTQRSEDPDHRGARQYELTAWGRRYASDDGRLRDLWVPSPGRPRTDRPDAEKAALANVAAFGEPLHNAPRGRRAPAPNRTAPQNTERARVFGYGGGTGGVHPVADWTAAEAKRRFTEYTAPVFARAAADTTTRRPGPDCVTCKALDGCTTVRRVPNLWGGTSAVPPRKRRSVSVWDLRVHATCPAQYHLTRQLHLDALVPEHPGAVRGRAVDAVLNRRHSADTRGPRGCRDLPVAADTAWSAEGYELTPRTAAEATAMLGQHRALCPLNGLHADEEVRVQPTVSCYVPELDVVVLAVPDLLFTRDAGGWVWHETKTASQPLRGDVPLMRAYPQLALGVLMLAAGTTGADPRRSWVEFELLHPTDAAWERLDPGHGPVVDEARDVIASLAEPLLHDTTYAPRPGRECHGCAVRKWCVEGEAHVARRIPTARTADDDGPHAPARPEPTP